MLEHGDTHQKSVVDTLIERGGLRVDHWQEIAKSTDIPDYNPDIRKRALPQTVARIRAYADRVITGEFPDSGLHHRDYLGRRHWRYLTETQTVKEVEPPFTRFQPWPRKTRELVWVMPDEVREYSSAEMGSTYTLNDYIENGFGDPFKWEDDKWSIFKEHSGSSDWQTDKDGIVVNASKTGLTTVGASDIEELLKSLLLNIDDLGDPVRTSPKVIKEMLIGLALEDPKEIKARLMSRVGSASLHQRHHFGIVEKEIDVD